jgi:hypothetical protein
MLIISVEPKARLITLTEALIILLHCIFINLTNNDICRAKQCLVLKKSSEKQFKISQ